MSLQAASTISFAFPSSPILLSEDRSLLWESFWEHGVAEPSTVSVVHVVNNMAVWNSGKFGLLTAVCDVGCGLLHHSCWGVATPHPPHS